MVFGYAERAKDPVQRFGEDDNLANSIARRIDWPKRGRISRNRYQREVTLTLKMTAMNVGPLSPDKNLLVAFAPGHVEVPTTSAVIVHPVHGVIVWDTG